MTSLIFNHQLTSEGIRTMKDRRIDCVEFQPDTQMCRKGEIRCPYESPMDCPVYRINQERNWEI